MIHQLATVALGPLLYVQGYHVRRVTPMLQAPKGPRRGTNGRGPRIRLICVGDSSAEGVGAESYEQTMLAHAIRDLEDSCTIEWKLIARSGARTSDMLERLKRHPRADFDVALTALGVNDVTSRRSLRTWRLEQRAIIALLRNRFRARHVIASGLPPVRHFPALPQPLRWYLAQRAQQFDAELRRVTGEEACQYVGFNFESDISEMATDGFHPGPPVYEKWGHAVAQRIRECVLAKM